MGELGPERAGSPLRHTVCQKLRSPLERLCRRGSWCLGAAGLRNLVLALASASAFLMEAFRSGSTRSSSTFGRLWLGLLYSKRQACTV